MAGQVGRISGGVLQDNLVRNGVDLNFKNETLDTALLQLKVNTARIGVNTETPSSDLDVDGIIAGDTLLQDTYLTVANFTIQNSEINVAPGDMYLNAADQIQLSSLSTDNIKLDFNIVSSTTPNTNLELRPNGDGELDIYANTNVTGSIHATGNITFGGNLTLGNDNTDSVDFNSDVNSHIIPDATDSYDLGSSSKYWRNLYTGGIIGDLLAANVVIVEGSSLGQRQGNILYVAINGSDTNVGDHPNGPFRTIAHALAVADGSTAGPVTVHVYPGEYEETTPLIVPQNTTVTGEDIRNTIIRPTTASQGEDIFHLNQNTLVENVTIKDFIFDSGNNTGYAFRFASGAIINERSPYVRNISVITSNTTTGSGEITVGPGYTSVSFTPDSVNLDKSLYTSQEFVDSLVGQTAVLDRYPLQPLFYEVVSVVTDPVYPSQWRMTFDTTIDLTAQLKPISFYPTVGVIELVTNDIWDTTGSSIGEKWVAWYKTNLPLNFETTVQPGWTINVAGTLYTVDYIIEDPINTNMWRIYVTTSLVGGFGIPIFSSPLVTNNIAGKGAWIDGSELNSLSTQASMLFHSATFITPGVDAITMTNGVRVEWLNSFTYFANIGLYATQGTAGFANLGTEFGAEIRSIGSASVYGNYGAVADGADTLMYLIGQNFAYIGAGADATNDSTLTLRDQEAVELNSGKIYYVSTDARGTFRVGNVFYVDFDLGETSINANTIDFSGVSAIVVNTGAGITYIDGSRVDTGNIRISGNTIETLNGDLILEPISGFVDVSSNKGFVVPRGTTAQRLLSVADFRYNTSLNAYEGYSTTNTSFNGVYSENRATQISGNNISNDVIFKVSNTEVGRLTAGKITLTGYTTSDILIQNSLITTSTSNSNLELSPDGTGRVYFDDLSIIDNVVDNVSNNNLTITNTGQGYLKFDNIRGLVVPSGTDLERPLTPPIGTTRWSTERDYLETWNGVEWQRAAGEGETVTAEIMGEILDIYTLVLG